ncbi:MAG: RDD family protein [Acidobacteria bacterium]|nr:RDD family protein [Acidobacteriota bacterium]
MSKQAPPIQKPVPPAPVKTNTTEIAAKPTSPTLVEFQNKNATLPDWRLQLQNAVRKRAEHGHAPPPAESKPAVAVSRIALPTSGANALKAEIVEEAVPVTNANPKLASALRRIEESRRRFLAEEATPEPPKAPPAAAKSYPFYLATKNAEVLPKPAEPKPVEPKTVPVLPKTVPVAPPSPILEELPVIEKREYDTNKLKPLPNSSIIATNLDKVSGELIAPAVEIKDAPRIRISRVTVDEDELLEIDEHDAVDEEDPENEDLAPFAMRFNAGLFDLIIGAFVALILLAPFMLSAGQWRSIAGLFAFLVTTAIVMFVYLTTAVGMFGKSLGMKLFSLETIDIEENDYPTFHQAAVSSSVYLVSLALGGIGFLPALFNSERRTAPDLLSGTIVVRE